MTLWSNRVAPIFEWKERKNYILYDAPSRRWRGKKKRHENFLTKIKRRLGGSKRHAKGENREKKKEIKVKYKKRREKRGKIVG